MTPPIFTPDGTEVEEVILPDGSEASEVIAPDGTVVFNAIPDSEVISRPEDDDSVSVDDKRGLRITALYDLTKIQGTISANSSGYTTAYLQTTGGSVLDSTDISGLTPGDSFELVASLSANTDYDVVLDAGGSSWTLGFYGSANYPYSGEIAEITKSVRSSGDSTAAAYSIVSIKAFSE